MAQAAAQLLSFTARSNKRRQRTVRITAVRRRELISARERLSCTLCILPELVVSDQTDNLLRREADLAVRMYRLKWRTKTRKRLR
jgi:hypothetical protein